MENRKSPNFLYLRGNLGRDPELKEFGEYAKASFSLGITERWTSKDGKENEKTLWIDCEFWNDKATKVMDELKKGSFVELEGSLALDSWDDKTTGQKRYKHYVKGFDFQKPEFEKKNNDESTAEAPKKKRGRPKAKVEMATVGEPAEALPDEIPF